MLKRRLFCFVLFLLSSFCFAQYVQNFQLVNNTGVDIYYVYASPASAGTWEQDILGEQIFTAGSTTSITLKGYNGVRYWDLMVEDAYGYEVYWEDLDLFSIKKMTLEINTQGEIVAYFNDAQYVQDFVLENQIGSAIYYIYASPVSSDSWEEDILGDDVLLHTESKNISFSGYPGVRYWDIMVVDEFDNEVYWESVDLYAIRRMVLEKDRAGNVIANFF